LRKLLHWKRTVHKPLLKPDSVGWGAWQRGFNYYKYYSHILEKT